MDLFALLPAYVPPLLFGFSLLMFGVAFLTYRNACAFLSTATQADGTVIRLEERRDSDGDGRLFYPVFTFRDASGREHEIVSSTGSSPAPYRVGARVRVLYQPDSPAGARLNSFMSLWGMPAFCVAFGVVSLFVGTCFYFVNH